MPTSPAIFCRSSVDLVEFGVNYIPCQNYVLCLSLIPYGTLTKNEKVYQLTWDDLRNAINILCYVVHCSELNSLMCIKLQQLLSDKYAASYLRSDIQRWSGFS
jgi:hypothetical protein